MPNTLTTYLDSRLQAMSLGRYIERFYKVDYDFTKLQRNQIQLILTFPDTVTYDEALARFGEAWEASGKPFYSPPVWVTVPAIRDTATAPPVAPVQSIHEVIEERASLAAFYARDGAFLSAARIYRELADKLQEHHRDTHSL